MSISKTNPFGPKGGPSRQFQRQVAQIFISEPLFNIDENASKQTLANNLVEIIS